MVLGSESSFISMSMASSRKKSSRIVSPPSRARAKAALRGEVVEVFRRTILDAAEKVFGERGFDAARMAEIAAQAGVAAGTLYNYYASKEQIFRALIEHRGEEFVKRLQSIAVEAETTRTKLIRITSATLEYIETHSAMFSLFVQLGGMAEWSIRRLGGPAAEGVYVRFVRQFEDQFAAGRREGLIHSKLSPSDLSRVFTGGLNGFLHGWLMQGRKERLSQRAEDLVDLFLQGAGHRP